VVERRPEEESGRMPPKVIVTVLDADDPSRGEITVLDGVERAERYVESLLEGGLDQNRIRVFLASEIEMRVAHKPVVSLLGEAPGEARPRAVSHANGEPQDAGEGAGTEQGEPYVRNGVRFSSLFRSA
jgi:hypothetical protein